MRIIPKNATSDQEKLEALLSNTVKEGDCLVWTRCFNTDGYPRMAGNVKVHRLVYSLSSGVDITNLVVRHKCDNIKCINPEHLIHGTHLDNLQDMVDRDRYFRVITGEIVIKTKQLLATKLLSNKEIALILGVDPRRVSDIKNGLYSDQGRFLGRG